MYLHLSPLMSSPNRSLHPHHHHPRSRFMVSSCYISTRLLHFITFTSFNHQHHQPPIPELRQSQCSKHQIRSPHPSTHAVSLEVVYPQLKQTPKRKIKTSTIPVVMKFIEPHTPPEASMRTPLSACHPWRLFLPDLESLGRPFL